jgi:OOP family OmpA-OmpF porin
MTISRLNDRAARPIAIAMAGLALAACQPQAPAPGNAAEDTPTVNATPIENSAKPEAKSIIRPDIEPAPTPSPIAAPVTLTIPFPAKGTRPDAASLARLDALTGNAVYQQGGPITIWGHSDSAGSDAVNLAASRRRATMVRDYLIGKGTSPDRITVIALGEARPIAPNRKLDGSDDPEGRDRNRRVEIKVDVPSAGMAAPAGEMRCSGPASGGSGCR